jgi:hypothetical protein
MQAAQGKISEIQNRKIAHKTKNKTTRPKFYQKIESPLIPLKCLPIVHDKTERPALFEEMS